MTNYKTLCAELIDHARLAQMLLTGEGLWDGDEDDGLLDRARAALATDPEPPDTGEVAELVNHLLKVAAEDESDGCTYDSAFTRRAAELLERLALQPVPEGPSDKEIEGVARLIYRAMQDATAQLTPDWTERGNSGMQDTARGAARAVLARWGQP